MKSQHITLILSGILAFTFCEMLCQETRADERHIEEAFGNISLLREHSESQKKLIAESLSLGKKDVSDFMLKAMNGARGRDPGANAVMTCVLRAIPLEGLEWLMDNYRSLSAWGRYNMVESLRRLDQVEAYEILFSLLDDQSVIGDRRAARLSVGPRYIPLRVCDHACNALRYMLTATEAQKRTDVPNRIFSHTVMRERREIINGWKKWRKRNKTEVLDKKKEVPNKPLELKKKIATFHEKINQVEDNSPGNVGRGVKEVGATRENGAYRR